MTTDMPSADLLHRVSIVIPVYRGERTLPTLINEILPLTVEQKSPSGSRFVISELLLVHDCGPDRSDLTIQSLTAAHPFVRVVWLSRNFGQHAATLAGMASATGNWVVTMDEDGQQDPTDIGDMLDIAVAKALQLVYAKPRNPPPHGWFRNTLSRSAKTIVSKILGNNKIAQFNSFRLVDGEISRTLAAYCGYGVYLDMSLYWITERIGHCPVTVRREMDRPSSYNYTKLLIHFWNLIFTTGTRPLRLITFMGFASVILAMAIAGYAIHGKLSGNVTVQGWASLLIIVAFFSGCILTALGIIAEYLVVTMNITQGKPLYVVLTKPTRQSDTP